MEKAKVGQTTVATKVAKAKQDEARNSVALPLVQAREEPRPLVEVLGATAYWDSALKEVAAAKSTVFVAS